MLTVWVGFQWKKEPVATQGVPASDPASTSIEAIARPAAVPQRRARSVPGEVTLKDSLQPLPALYTVVVESSPHEWVEQLRTDILTAATPEDYAQQQSAANGGDPEAALWLSMFYYSCIHGPRAAWQLEARLELGQQRLDQYLKDHPGSDEIPEYLFGFADHWERVYQLCSVLPPEVDAAWESIEWMETAADLGHQAAQFAYFEFVANLLMGFRVSLAFKYPELIQEYRWRADAYAQALLRSEHPERYILLSMMYWSGLVYDRDDVMAYAYAKATELAIPEQAQVARIRMKELQRWVSPEDRDRATTVAHEILRQDRE